MAWKLKPERMLGTLFGGHVPSWTIAISRGHALGQRGFDDYVHIRAGERTRAFCRRIYRAERKANRLGLESIAKLARTFRLGARRYGFRGATDTWVNAVCSAADGMIRKALVEYAGDASRRASFLARTIRSAIEKLCGPLKPHTELNQDVLK
jgi:hypothetical protein